MTGRAGGERLHEDELGVDTDTVGRLVARDRPDLAGRPLRVLTTAGSSNVLVRLGDEHLVRLPRQPGGGAALDKEARWAPVLGPALPVALPRVEWVGEPGFGYPERWALTGWIDGWHPRTPEPAADDLARDLAAFLQALRCVDVPATPDPQLSGYRAGELRAIDTDVRDYLQQCRGVPGLDLDLDACAAVWDAAMTLPACDGPARWVHADLLAENLLVREGRLAAVLDLGALAVGCPDADLMVAWEVLDVPGRSVFRAALDVDEAAWQRGRAWALAVAVMTFPYYWRTMPQRCAARLAMARAVLAG